MVAANDVFMIIFFGSYKKDCIDINSTSAQEFWAKALLFPFSTNPRPEVRGYFRRSFELKPTLHLSPQIPGRKSGLLPFLSIFVATF